MTIDALTGSLQDVKDFQAAIDLFLGYPIKDIAMGPGRHEISETAHYMEVFETDVAGIYAFPVDGTILSIKDQLVIDNPSIISMFSKLSRIECNKKAEENIIDI